jgi:hypothetical protein
MKRSAQLQSVCFSDFPSIRSRIGNSLLCTCLALLLLTVLPGTAGAASASAFQVYSNGVFHWGGDYSWGVSINYQDTAGSPLSGPYDVAVSGIGGFQPYATNYNFDPSPYQYLVVSLKPTIPNQKWDSGVYAVGNALAGRYVNVLDYGPAPVVGQWTTYKIPLGAGGYQIPAGTHIEQFMFIDQTADVQGSGYSTNRWYVDNLYFTSDGSSTATASQTSTTTATAASTSTTSATSTAAATQTYPIYANGKYDWTDDWSWGVTVNYKDTAGDPLSGSYDISVKGIGGYQPHAPNSDFDPSPYKYLTVSLKPTIANQKWDSAFYATDGSVAGSVVHLLNYGPAPVVGQWNTYKIPLGAGGYGIPAGKHIFKFMFIDQTADSSSAYTTNTWYVDNLGFTTDGSAVATSGSGSTSTGSTGTTTSGSGTTTTTSGVTWMYLNGVKTLAGDFTGQGESTNYQHATSSGYNGGTKDILITSGVPWGYFIPYWASNYRLPNPGYKNLLFQIKPTITGDTFAIHAERVGDSPLTSIELTNYCGAFTAGQWTSCTVPLSVLGVAGDSTLYKVVIATHTAKADSWEMDAIGFK